MTDIPNPDPKEFILNAYRDENALATGLFDEPGPERVLLMELDDLAQQQPPQLREAYLMRVAASALTHEANLLRLLGPEAGATDLRAKAATLELEAPRTRFRQEPPRDDGEE